MAKAVNKVPGEIPIPDKYPETKPHFEPEEPHPTEWDPDSIAEEDPFENLPDDAPIAGEGP